MSKESNSDTKRKDAGVNARTGDLRGIQKHCPSMQGGD